MFPLILCGYLSQTYSIEGIMSNSTIEHLKKSVHFLTLRIKSEYSDEFVEQRWSSMMMLGTVYVHFMVRSIIYL